MQSYAVHMRNVFPLAVIIALDSSISAQSLEGELLCIVEKNGAGQWLCGKDAHGAKFAWSLERLAKDTCVKKLGRDGKVSDDEKADERRPLAVKLAKERGGRVPSAAELLREMATADGRDPAQVHVTKDLARSPDLAARAVEKLEKKAAKAVDPKTDAA